MPLNARIKPALTTHADTPVGTTWRALCGFLSCRGVLGHLGYREDVGGGDGRVALAPVWLILAAGYVQQVPGVWRLGRHAARRHDQRPRRPRFSRAPTTARASRTPPGYLLLPDGSTPYEALMMRRGLGVFGAASYGAADDPDIQLVQVAVGEALTIDCPRCHAPSRLVIPAYFELLAAQLAAAGERGRRPRRRV